MRTHTSQRFLLVALVIVTAFSLSGCFKGEVSVDVNANGSGLVGIAAGVTQKGKALLATQGEGGDLKSQLQKMLINQAGSSMGLKFDSWVDGDYEWVKVEKEAGNVDEINQLMAKTGLFKSFSLSQKSGLLQNQFVLSAEMDPIAAGMGMGALEGFQVDTSEFMQMQFSLRLPGTITETNGLADAADANKLTWSMLGNQPLSVNATSVAWNWVGIVILAAVVMGLVVLGILVLLFVILRMKGKSNPATV